MLVLSNFTKSLMEDTMAQVETPKETRQDQVKDLIAKGGYTKKAIADELGIPVNSVSSQLTYLRWKGNNIMTDPDTKVLSFVTEEELKAHEDAVKAARAAKASSATSKSPQERANALAVTIKRQETQLAGFNKKVEAIEKDMADDIEAGKPEDPELAELLEEAKANATLMRIKIKRNKELAASLPEPAEITADAGDDTGSEPDADETDIDEDLD